MKKKFVLERKLIAQVRFYEVLYAIRDERNELIFTGSEETAKRLQKVLTREAAQRKAKRK